MYNLGLTIYLDVMLPNSDVEWPNKSVVPFSRQSLDYITNCFYLAGRNQMPNVRSAIAHILISLLQLRHEACVELKQTSR